MAYSRIRFEIQNSATMTLVQSTSVKSLRFRLEQLRQCCPLFRRAALRPLFLGIAAKMIVKTEKLMNNHVIVGPFTSKKYAACC